MKKILFFVCLCFACGGEKKQEKTAIPNTDTILFIDKSESMNWDSAVYQKYNGVLQRIIKENIQQQKDRIRVYLIHENTTQGFTFELICRTPIPSEENRNANDMEATNTTYQIDLAKEQAIFYEKVKKELQQKNNAESNRNTDIWGALALINPEKEYQTKAYFFSDMVESMRGEKRRDFYKKPPMSKKQAIDWAEEDKIILKNELKKLANVKVIIIKPFDATASSKQNNPYIANYWDALLEI